MYLLLHQLTDRLGYQLNSDNCQSQLSKSITPVRYIFLYHNDIAHKSYASLLSGSNLCDRNVHQQYTYHEDDNANTCVLPTFHQDICQDNTQSVL